MPKDPDRAAAWGRDQRALAKALGLTIEEWLAELEAASQRSTGLTAAVVGAAMASGLGLSVLDRLDPAGLAARARVLIDPRPPKTESPVLAEAIRRAEEAGGPTAGTGARLLKRTSERPPRIVQPDYPSAETPTSDAPGEDEP